MIHLCKVCIVVKGLSNKINADGGHFVTVATTQGYKVIHKEKQVGDLTKVKSMEVAASRCFRL